MNSKSDVDHDKQRNFGYRSGDQTSQILSKLCHGNFFVIGAIWIELMKKIMIGKRTFVVPLIYNSKNVIPTAKQEETKGSSPEAHHSEKKCKKKSVDSPSDCGRMANYYSKWVFAGGQENMIHRRLFPFITNTKMIMMEKWKNSNISDALYSSKSVVKNKILKVKEHIADPNNCVKEKVLVSVSAATGVIAGSRYGLGKAIFNGGLGALASGLFCLRRKTEDFFRNILLRSMVADDKRNT